MHFNYRLGHRAMDTFGLLILTTSSAFASTNLWESTFGQRWFYEVRSSPGEVVAGTWWEHSLTPGKTYRISFDVKKVQGKMGLLVGNNPAVTIGQPGSYSFDFNISEGGKRRMIFKALSSDVVASVVGIAVTERWDGAARSPTGGNPLPKGHYLSFDRERNLKTEMMDRVDKPWTSPSSYHTKIANELHDALTTPGIKGMYMAVDWRTVEVGDGRFDWRLMDDNVAVARRYGLKMIFKIADRSFDGTNIMPAYFPSKYVLPTTGGGKSGFTAKRWDPWVYNRTIRLYKAIARRYANDSGFGGIATTETATGNFSGGDYNVWKYRQALTQIVTQTQAAMPRGRLFFYLNFLRGGESSDMNKDMRIKLLQDVPHHSLVVGGPDVTPDVRGMVRSVTPYRIHARKKMSGLSQFCHLQHRDHGAGGINAKSNGQRLAYFDEVATIRQRERQPWFSGTPAVFEFDDLRDPSGNGVKLHPNGVLGKLWNPWELFSYGRRNFGCDYVFWHWREWSKWNEFSWPDVRPVVLNNQYF